MLKAQVKAASKIQTTENLSSSADASSPNLSLITPWGYGSHGHLPLGIYGHIPFCAHACDFCAFYKEEPNRAELDRYMDAMRAEILRARDSWLSLELASVRVPDTVFWGGGTPGLLPARDLERLAVDFRQLLPAPIAEWTVEMAPSTVKPDKLKVLKDQGVTRISMGVQSLNPKTLDALGRRHSPGQIKKAVDMIRAAGFDNLNLDLIFAIPDQSPQDWAADLREILALQPDHISTYCLTFEDDTALWVKLQKGAIRRHSEEDEAAFYETSMDVLESAGICQYEVSNFSLPGHECKHNLNTWHMAEWVGLGPSAASQYGLSSGSPRRWQNASDLSSWISGIESNRPSLIDESRLNADTLFADCLIFGLRLNRGVYLPALQARFPNAPLAQITPLFDLWQQESLLTCESDWIRLTRKGRLLADAIGAEILDRLSV